MFKTITYTYKPTKNERNFLKLLCHISKNLYNACLYNLRQKYFKEQKILTINELEKTLKYNINYHILNKDSKEDIIKTVYTLFTNFTKGYTKLPKYLEKNNFFQITTKPTSNHNNNEIKLQQSYLTKSSKIFNKIFEDELASKFIKESGLKNSIDITIKIPKFISQNTIKSLKIIPKFKGLTYKIVILYITNDKIQKPQKIIDNIMAIDLGINNLASCITSKNDAFIIDGKYLKSINHFYNKQKAYFQSKKPNQLEFTLKEYQITEKRNNRIKDAINKAAKQIINYAIKNQIQEIIVGYNKGIKTHGITNIQNTKTRKRINQNFIQIPLFKFKNILKYMAESNNIIFTEINESYTSICSFYDNEEIKYHQKYQGKRITRSLFKTKNNKIINADINAALNILAKCKPERKDILTFLRNNGHAIPIRQKIKLN